MARRILSFAPEAEREAHEAFRWYWERDEQAGARFEAELLAVFDRITEAPEQGPEIEGGVRRMLLHRFPYSVLYALEPERVFIVAERHEQVYLLVAPAELRERDAAASAGEEAHVA